MMDDLTNKIRIIADGGLSSPLICLSNDEIVQICQDLRGLKYCLDMAEQERDQYKAELESLRAKIKESQKEIVRMQGELYKSNMYNKDLHSEICGLRTKINEAQEPIYLWRLEDDGWMECTKEWFDAAISAGYEKRIVYAAPIIPD